MFIIHGQYHLARRRTGYRNDFCLACERQRLAEQWRTFDILHVFWIPLLPLGFWRRWHCTVCGRNPHDRVKTSRFVKYAGMFCCLFFGLIPILASKPGELLQMLPMVGLAFAGFVYLIYCIRTEAPPPRLTEELKRVPPLTGDACPYCGGWITNGPVAQCATCGVRRDPVN